MADACRCGLLACPITRSVKRTSWQTQPSCGGASCPTVRTCDQSTPAVCLSKLLWWHATCPGFKAQCFACVSGISCCVYAGDDTLVTEHDNLPADSLALSMASIWGVIRSQKDLNLPAHKVWGSDSVAGRKQAGLHWCFGQCWPYTHNAGGQGRVTDEPCHFVDLSCVIVACLHCRSWWRRFAASRSRRTNSRSSRWIRCVYQGRVEATPSCKGSCCHAVAVPWNALRRLFIPLHVRRRGARWSARRTRASCMGLGSARAAYMRAVWPGERPPPVCCVGSRRWQAAWHVVSSPHTCWLLHVREPCRYDADASYFDTAVRSAQRIELLSALQQLLAAPFTRQLDSLAAQQLATFDKDFRLGLTGTAGLSQAADTAAEEVSWVDWFAYSTPLGTRSTRPILRVPWILRNKRSHLSLDAGSVRFRRCLPGHAHTGRGAHLRRRACGFAVQD